MQTNHWWKLKLITLYWRLSRWRIEISELKSAVQGFSTADPDIMVLQLKACWTTISGWITQVTIIFIDFCGFLPALYEIRQIICNCANGQGLVQMANWTLMTLMLKTWIWIVPDLTAGGLNLLTFSSLLYTWEPVKAQVYFKIKIDMPWNNVQNRPKNIVRFKLYFIIAKPMWKQILLYGFLKDFHYVFNVIICFLSFPALAIDHTY